jgi:transketolase
MPSTQVFDSQDAAYRDSVLPPAIGARVAVEAAATEGWWRYVGSHGAVIGMTSFGASGVAKDLFKHFGFTADKVVATVERVLQAVGRSQK